MIMTWLGSRQLAYEVKTYSSACWNSFEVALDIKLQLAAYKLNVTFAILQIIGAYNFADS